MTTYETRLAQAWADNALIEIRVVPDICTWIVRNAEKLGHCEHNALSAWRRSGCAGGAGQGPGRSTEEGGGVMDWQTVVSILSAIGTCFGLVMFSSLGDAHRRIRELEDNGWCSQLMTWSEFVKLPMHYQGCPGGTWAAKVRIVLS